MLGSMLDSESLTQQAVRRQLAAMPSKFYLIRLIHSVERKPAPAKCLWPRVELVRDEVVRSLRADNRLGFNVYLWPYAERRNAGYIFLDLDHARPDILQDMRIHGHEPCVVLETSPGHLQAWVHVSTKPLEPAVATTLGRFLAERYRGDRASTDWRHLGRLAGFRNFKPAICGLTGLPPTVQILYAEPVLATAAQQLLDVAQEWLALYAKPSTTVHSAASSVSTTQELGAAPRPHIGITPKGAAAVYQRCPQPDWSIVDLWLASKLLAQHTPPAQVMEILRLGSPGFPRNHGNPEDYLRRTLARAATPSSPRPVCGASPSDVRLSARRA